MEPNDWIAVAQVYAGLAQAWSVEIPRLAPESLTALSLEQMSKSRVYKYEQKALMALRIAGVTDA